MKIFVVYGVDQTGYYPSGNAEVHYVGTDEAEALLAISEARKDNDNDWKINVEAWEDGKKVAVLINEI